MTSEEAARHIAEECDALKEMLLAKNRAYGNSALEPLRVFSKALADEQIKVRLDDKLSRLARGSGEEMEDVEADIMGYLILMRVHRRRSAPPPPTREDIAAPLAEGLARSRSLIHETHALLVDGCPDCENARRVFGVNSTSLPRR